MDQTPANIMLVQQIELAISRRRYSSKQIKDLPWWLADDNLFLFLTLLFFLTGLKYLITCCNPEVSLCETQPSGIRLPSNVGQFPEHKAAS